MMFMNEYEVDDAVWNLQRIERLDGIDLGNLRKIAESLSSYRDWVNSVSDGWPYWSPAIKAARKAQEALQSFAHAHWRGNGSHEDVDRATVTAALRPMRAFVTRHGGDAKAVVPA